MTQLSTCKEKFCIDRSLEFRMEKGIYSSWSEDIKCYTADGELKNYYPKDIWNMCGIELKPNFWNYISLQFWLRGGINEKNKN